MELTAALTEAAVEEAMPGRPVRWYPALLSTEADALAWARAGGPSGAVVTANYQASPRGRAGLEWRIPGTGTAFSLVVRPQLRAEREGWLYSVAVMGVLDAVEGSGLRWPDQVLDRGARAAAIGVHAELGPQGVDWAVINALIEEAGPAPAATIATVVEAIEARLQSDPQDVLADYLEHCETIGSQVRARMIPLGPGGVEISGRAAGSVLDGALIIVTDADRRIAVRPQHLGILEV